ncbi:baseplate J/gp47 family protein [Bathymodiolus septemdierum thioautotrophic gill symbiont]|uniref:Uncharacterized protein n=1 Tax=endosymbiont of Bathymodiolus septemdierum str. Myojin knoll TaxID=1303921 RepID=A0A0P0UR98_9GAMM|nr:baseplate J/gp47 family protein [Bathymodiolus septemdierum thioautotrophic gill symbiont]BAS67627.1 hypothetical protein BSEPE_0623 [endosymbiont of Bathymodiolus septemdierum str. Myojin knoll]
MKTDLKSIIERVIADFEFSTGEKADANQVIEALIGAFSGANHAIYRYIDNRLNQMFPALADEDWLKIWASITKTPRLDNEAIDSWRKRINAALAGRNRFGRTEDLIAWGLLYDDVTFVYVQSNTPENGITTLVLGSNDILSDARKSTLLDEISENMHEGTFLMLKQSEPQPVNFEITADAQYRQLIESALSKFIKNTNGEADAQITIAKIHAQIESVTDVYTLHQPAQKITAQNSKHLVLGVITWQ